MILSDPKPNCRQETWLPKRVRSNCAARVVAGEWAESYLARVLGAERMGMRSDRLCPDLVLGNNHLEVKAVGPKRWLTTKPERRNKYARSGISISYLVLFHGVHFRPTTVPDLERQLYHSIDHLLFLPFRRMRKDQTGPADWSRWRKNHWLLYDGRRYIDCYGDPPPGVHQNWTEDHRCAAGVLLDDLRTQRLSVGLLDAPSPRHCGHKIRVTMSHNPEWYSRLASHFLTDRPRRRARPEIDRKRVTRMLMNISKGKPVRSCPLRDLLVGFLDEADY